MRIACLVLCVALSGCATAPTEPKLEPGMESSAAVANPGFWRWAGRVVYRLITNTMINIKIETQKEEKSGG